MNYKNLLILNYIIVLDCLKEEPQNDNSNCLKQDMFIAYPALFKKNE